MRPACALPFLSIDLLVIAIFAGEHETVCLAVFDVPKFRVSLQKLSGMEAVCLTPVFAARGHLGIENDLYWNLDISFRED